MEVFLPNEGLVESRKIDKNDKYELYESISIVYPFVKFQEELKEINDYCYFVIKQLKDKIIGLIEKSNCNFKIVEKKKQIEEIDEWDFEEATDPAFSNTGVIKWENILNNINKPSMLLILLSYLESSLDEIANWFCETQKISIGKKERGISKIEFYIMKIGECCHCDLLNELSVEMIYLKKVKEIRNKLVHKEWDQVEKFDDKFYLCEVFNMISTIFRKVEKVACDAKIVEEWSLEKIYENRK